MGIDLQRLKKNSSVLKSLGILLVSFFVISCSQVVPELMQPDYSIVFDYNDEVSAPEARLSLFYSSASDVRRYNRVTLVSLDTGYIWDTPTGKYEITYINADEKECRGYLDISYDTGFYDVLLPELSEVMHKSNGIEKIAIYDEQYLLLYFGERKKEFQTTRGIWNQYPDAKIYQVIWYSRNGKVICIEPERKVTPDEN